MSINWKFDPRISELLLLSGWKEDRQVLISEDIGFLQENNFSPNETVEAILSSFSGIKIFYGHEKFEFDLEGAIFWYPSFSVKFKNLLAKEICPLGYSNKNIFL